MKQKLILFLVMSILYGAGMALMLVGITESWLKYAIMSGLFFGLMTTAILSFIQWANLKRTGQSASSVVKVHNTLQLEIAASKQEAFGLCTHALQQVNKCSIEQSNFSLGILTASAGVNWLTWGDEIELHILETAHNRCTISLSSRPKVKTTLIDYGKNRENIRRMVDFILAAPYQVNITEDEGHIFKTV